MSEVKKGKNNTKEEYQKQFSDNALAISMQEEQLVLL